MNPSEYRLGRPLSQYATEADYHLPQFTSDLGYFLLQPCSISPESQRSLTRISKKLAQFWNLSVRVSELFQLAQVVQVATVGK